MKPLLYLFCLATCTLAQAQSFCASDGERTPVALVERFISADCEACWSDAGTPKTTGRQVAIDWIVPSARGDDAPLSAAASRDALSRLQALGRSAPTQTLTITSPVGGAKAGAKALPLRVAHGLPFNDYIAASIEMKPAPVAAASSSPWTAWLVLVETIPAGQDGTPVARNLTRNALESIWDTHKQLSKSEQIRFFESRPMYIPPGAHPERLRVLGWVQDARGHVLAAAQSRCKPGG